MVTEAMAGDTELLENLQCEERWPGMEPWLMSVLKGWAAIKDTEQEHRRDWQVNWNPRNYRLRSLSRRGFQRGKSGQHKRLRDQERWDSHMSMGFGALR